MQNFSKSKNAKDWKLNMLNEIFRNFEKHAEICNN